MSATLHCLTGCAIGEVLGMVIDTALGWPAWATVALAVGLAFWPSHWASPSSSRCRSTGG